MNIIIKKILINRKLVREVLLYGIIGGSSSLMDSLFYYFFTRHLNFSEFASNFFSVNIGITISFVLNTFINFKITNKIIKRALSFYTVGYIGLLVSMIILYCGIHIFSINDMFVKLTSIFIVAAFQFVLNKVVTYGKIK